MADVKTIQAQLRADKIDGWLFCDHHHRDPIAARVLGLPADGMVTRRWFYFIPKKGEPRKLVHRIERGALDSLAGSRLEYSSWQELHAGLRKLLTGSRTIATQYSPENNIPYIGLVDAGTIELVRKLKKRVVSSADLVQTFEATWTPAQLKMHLEAGHAIDRIVREAFEHAATAVREAKPITEYELQQWILRQFHASGLTTDEPPVVAVQPNNANPHYEPAKDACRAIRAGDLLLLDVWAKCDRPASVYYDVTWMGYLGGRVPEAYTRIFRIVREARDRAIECVKSSLAKHRILHGWEVDRAARESIRKAGYARHFIHRTGHSIGQDVHGNGANMDGFETRDDRTIMPRTCFSIEPGVYLPEFGIRSEVNVYAGEREAQVTGAVQIEILALLA